jgi:hypothetical protein
MTLRRFARRLITSAIVVLACTGVPMSAGAGDGEIAEASRKPGGINPADIDSRCAIMAGRTDRAFIPCFEFADAQGSGRTAAVEFLINNPPPARGPLRIYTDEEAQALGLIPGPGATGPVGPYRRR